MSYCSRSRRRRFTALDFKFEHIVAFTAIFSNICTAHAQKRLLMNFRCKFRHSRRFADDDFLLVCNISAIWRRFPLIFAFYMLNVGHIPTSGLFDLRFPLHFAFYMLNVHHISTSG